MYYILYKLFRSALYMISDSQIFVALLFALISAVLAIRLGTDLYQ